jgi:hypothetical protein
VEQKQQTVFCPCLIAYSIYSMIKMILSLQLEFKIEERLFISGSIEKKLVLFLKTTLTARI